MNAMPQLTDQHRQLHALAGRWRGEETMYPMPWSPGGQAQGRYEMRVDIDGFFVIQDYVQEREGQVSYRGHGIFGWDEPQQTYTWYWVDAMGFVPPAPARGHFADGVFSFESPPAPGMRARYRFSLIDADNIGFSMQHSTDDGVSWSTFMDGRYQRQA